MIKLLQKLENSKERIWSFQEEFSNITKIFVCFITLASLTILCSLLDPSLQKLLLHLKLVQLRSMFLESMMPYKLQRGIYFKLIPISALILVRFQQNIIGSKSYLFVPFSLHRFIIFAFLSFSQSLMDLVNTIKSFLDIMQQIQDAQKMTDFRSV